MLRAVGARDVDSLFQAVLQKYLFRGRLKLPPSVSELELKREVGAMLERNRTTDQVLSFLGAGCWQHAVPEVCNEINSRSEFLTAYTGDVYTDLGRFQALFEFQSLLGDLVAMDAVTYPSYDWATAAGDSMRMAINATGRREVLVPRSASPERVRVMQQYLGPGRMSFFGYDRRTGQVDLDDLEERISDKTAAVYIENPAYLGFVETDSYKVGRTAHANGALFVVGVEPLSLGVLKPPGEYGADIVCGEGQPLGLKQYFGGALLGFVACRDDERLLNATGARLITLTDTIKEGERGFAFALPERVMFAKREESATFTGTTAVLWAITAAVYLSLLGPRGVQELARTIMERSHYATKVLGEVPGVETPALDSPFFQEFTVNFGNKKVKEVHSALLRSGIQGGKDITSEFPTLGNSALYCATEVHSKEDIDRLGDEMRRILR
jgi:glycine dehydrogenase subunit 1